MKPVKRKYSQ